MRASISGPVGTFDLEHDLPRVPLPDLETSCARFLEWCAPLLTEDELAQTRAAVAHDLRPGGPLRREHERLVADEVAGTGHSWLDDFWRDRYLGRRDRIALNANFFFLLPDTGESQVDRAASLVAGALAHKAAVDAERLPPTRHRGRPLSMVQHRHLFSTTRIPGRGVDSVRTPYSPEWPGPSDARHIVVLRRGAMFRVDVLDDTHQPETEDGLRAGLRAVLDASPRDGAAAEVGQQLGQLTTLAREDWATEREHLLGLDPTNGSALDTLETALFCVCLADDTPPTAQDAADQLLHGDSGSRWYDKGLTFIVFPDGRAGINAEHCRLDGTTVASLLDEMATRELPGPAADPTRPPRRALVEPVEFVLDDHLRARIRTAGADFAAYRRSMVSACLELDGYGVEHIKALGISPDAFAQAAFQLARYRAAGSLGATYESVSTRAFHHGRTEAMRVVTPEMVAFVESMSDPAAPPGERVAALLVAAEAHVARARDCQQGQAPEQHLWELQLRLQRAGRPREGAEVLSIPESPGWRVVREDRLSTSAVPSVNVRLFGFGATGPRCIGVSYALLPQRLGVYLSAARASAETMHAFRADLTRSLAELRDLLTER